MKAEMMESTEVVQIKGKLGKIPCALVSHSYYFEVFV